MIGARRSRLFGWWFARQVEGRIRRMFREVRVAGLAETAALLGRGPVLVVSNHTSWWDPMFAILAVWRLWRADGYALMEAKNLRRLPFLGRVGGFGVDREVPGDAEEALRYGAALLDRSGRLVWVFPQGRERPLSEPLEAFKLGAARLALYARQRAIVPVALRYEFGATEQPVMWVACGAPFAYADDPAVGAAAQHAAVATELLRIDRAICAGEGAADFVSLWPPRRASGLAERVLAWLTR